MGLTQMSLKYQKERSDESLNNIYLYIINYWYTNSGAVCGTHYDINSFSSKFNIPRAYINGYMKETVLSSKIWDKDSQLQMLEGLISEQISWALEDRMEIVNQVNLLKVSQNGKYTPFITAELNKALKLRLESSTSLQSIIRSLSGGGSTSLNIYQQFNQNNNTVEDAQYITLDEARELIQEQTKLVDKSQEVKFLEANYDLESLPNVVANINDGGEHREISSINKDELNSVVDNYKESIRVSSKEHHEIRREIEQRIDPDEDDPELDIYEEINDEPEGDPSGFGSSPYLN